MSDQRLERLPTGEPVEDASLPELVGALGRDVSELMGAQIDLAKKEIQEEVRAGVKATGAMAGAAVVALVALVVVAHAAAWGIAEALPTWLSYLIVGVILAVVAAAMFAAGRKKLDDTTPVIPRTQQTLKGELP